MALEEAWAARCFINLYADATLLSAQIAEWHVHSCGTFKPIFPLSRISESVPRSLLLALPSSQAITPWATQTCNGGWHLYQWESNQGPYCLVA